MSSSKSSKSSSKDKSSTSKSKSSGTSSVSMSSVSKVSNNSSSKSQSKSSSSSSSATKRLLQELSRQSDASTADREPSSPIERLAPVADEELFHWEAVINGKGLGGGYDGGRWLLDIRVPDGRDKKSGGGGTYPLVPPVVKFVTRIVAPNVAFDTGDICLDLLKDAWTPAYTLKMTVEAIWQMLANPGVDSPLNVDVAALLRQGDRVGSEAVVRWGCGEWRWDGR